MATGDKPNQNLFGTNYNAEEEERKKAELETKRARIGAEGVPSLDSNIVSLVPGIKNIKNPGAFDPTIVEPVEPISPPTTVGESISQTYNESVLADLINKGFGQEAFQSQSPDGTPTFSIFNKRFGILGSQVPYSEASPEAKAQAIKFMLGTGGQERPLPETPTSPVRTPEQVQSILDEKKAAQASSALKATSSVTPPVESPSGGLQGQEMDMNQSAIMNALTDQNQGMDMNQQAIANAQGQEATVPPPAQTLSQFMRYEDAPEQRTEQFLDEQGRLRFRPTQEALQLQAQGAVAQPPVDSVVPSATTQPSTGPVKVPDEIMSQVARPAGQTAEFRDGNRDGIEDRAQGIFRPGELLGYDAQGNEVRSPGTQQPVNRIPASSQTPVDALSSFEQDSLSRQQRIGGTGSFEGDSEARDARVREMDRRPGESQADRDTRVAQSKTTGGQTEGLSFEDARVRARGQLAGRNPSASDINALARAIQAGEPERLAELETKRAINEARLKTAQATLDRPEFEGRVYTVNGVTFAQTSRGGAQVISTGTQTPEEVTREVQKFEFTKKKIEEAREAFEAGNLTKANDILTAAEIQKNGFDVTASEYFGGLTQQQEVNITRQAFDTMEEAEAANLPEGTKITIGGRNATV
jgi:hypothetical protein